MEKIEILPDGTIPEVKMTSQGVGEPFAPGEKILGYQVCGLSGNAYIDVDEVMGEKVTNITAGDELVFRYLKELPDYTGIMLETHGSGVLSVWINDRQAGKIRVVFRKRRYSPDDKKRSVYGCVFFRRCCVWQSGV